MTIVVTSVACSQRSDLPVVDEPVPSEVTVTRGSITSVITMDATVVAFPDVPITVRSAATNIEFVRRDVVVPKGRALATYSEQKGGSSRSLYLPAEADISQYALPPGSSAPPNTQIATARLHAVAIQAAVPEAIRYRMSGLTGYARAQINDAAGPMDCPLVDQVATVQRQDKTEQSVTCLPSQKERGLVPGAGAIMAVEASRVDNVLLLPVTAVAGKTGRGQVLVTEGGKLVEKTVGLGISDGTSVEITHGLEDGDVVQAAGPDLQVVQPNSVR